MIETHFVKSNAAEESLDRQANGSVPRNFVQVVGNTFKQFCTNAAEMETKRAEKRSIYGTRSYGKDGGHGSSVRIEVDEPAQEPAYTPELLRNLLRQKAGIYKKMLVEKKGTREMREVIAPIPTLKKIQRLLLMHLYKTTHVDQAAHGFVPGKGNWTAAAFIAAGMSKGKHQTILTQDLRKAFSSITEKQVREVLKRSGLKGFQLHVATRLTTYEGKLATGSPTSPWILNLILKEVDRKMRGWTKDRGGSYVRYADDCTIQLPTWRRSKLKVGRELLRRLCSEAGLELHAAKHKITRLGLDSDSAEIIGIAVQPQHATRPRRHRRRLRGLIRQAQKAKDNGNEPKFERAMQTIYGLAAYFAGEFRAMKNAKQERLKKLRFSTA